MGDNQHAKITRERVKSTLKSFHPMDEKIRHLVGEPWSDINGAKACIRRRHFVSKESISVIANSLNLSRQTVRKALRGEAEPIYQRKNQPTPKLGAFKSRLAEWLERDVKLPKRQRRTAQRLFECLQVEGYQGSKVQCSGLYWTGNNKRRIGHRLHKPLFPWHFQQVKPVSLTGAMNMSY